VCVPDNRADAPGRPRRLARPARRGRASSGHVPGSTRPPSGERVRRPSDSAPGPRRRRTPVRACALGRGASRGEIVVVGRVSNARVRLDRDDTGSTSPHRVEWRLVPSHLLRGGRPGDTPSRRRRRRSNVVSSGETWGVSWYSGPFEVVE
jgi:hypothetical protein